MSVENPPAQPNASIKYLIANILPTDLPIIVNVVDSPQFTEFVEKIDIQTPFSVRISARTIGKLSHEAVQSQNEQVQRVASRLVTSALEHQYELPNAPEKRYESQAPLTQIAGLRAWWYNRLDQKLQKSEMRVIEAHNRLENVEGWNAAVQSPDYKEIARIRSEHAVLEGKVRLRVAQEQHQQRVAKIAPKMAKLIR